MPEQRKYLSGMERAQDMMAATPRQRVSINRSTPMVLTGDWQTIPFVEGASASDTNTFPAPRYDFANQKVMANPATSWEQSYIFSLDLAVQLNAANTGAKLSVRFVVPRPAPQGGPAYFPLPESLGRVDLPDQIVAPAGAVHFDYVVYSNAAVRAYGAQIQIRATSYQLSSGGLLGGLVGALTASPTGNNRPTLTDAVLNMHAF